MNKVLEAFKDLMCYSACFHCQYYIDKECSNKDECCWKTIEKELKEGEKNKQALEIIKIFLDKMGISFRFESDLIICIFINNKFDGTFTCDTQEEYDLLKEVLL